MNANVKKTGDDLVDNNCNQTVPKKPVLVSKQRAQSVSKVFFTNGSVNRVNGDPGMVAYVGGFHHSQVALICIRLANRTVTNGW